MSEPAKQTTRTQIVLIAIGAFAFGAWFFHDGLKVMRTGRPIYLAHSKHTHNTLSAFECFMWSAGMDVLGLALLRVALKPAKDRPDA